MGGNTVMQPGKPLNSLGVGVSLRIADRLESARQRQEADRRARQQSVPTISPERRRPQDAPYFKSLPPASPEYLRRLKKNFPLVPRTFDDVMRLRCQDVGRCDMARLNLLCATGLPGTQDLDVDEYLHTLDVWSAWVAQQTDRDAYLLKRNPKEYKNSEPYWRVLSMTTTLQLQFGVHYEERLRRLRGWNWRDSRDVLLNGPLGYKRSGSCPSLPALLNAIGRRLGYPMYFVHAPAHVFSRWDGRRLYENPKWNEYFNAEYHGNGLLVHDDEQYRHWPAEWTPKVIEAERTRAKPLYLRSLEPPEELAGFLSSRSAVLFAHKRLDESYLAILKSSRLAPHNVNYHFQAQMIHREKLLPALAQWGITEAHFFAALDARQLGSPLKFPWEIWNPSPEPSSVSNSPLADPIKLSAAAHAAIHRGGRLIPGAFSLKDIPERTLDRPEVWKVPR